MIINPAFLARKHGQTAIQATKLYQAIAAARLGATFVVATPERVVEITVSNVKPVRP